MTALSMEQVDKPIETKVIKEHAQRKSSCRSLVGSTVETLGVQANDHLASECANDAFCRRTRHA